MCSNCLKEKVFAKGMCQTCYSRNWYRSKNKANPRKNKTRKIDIKKDLPEVIKMVEKGLSIQQSCKALNINRNYFYDLINKNDLKELKSLKALNRYKKPYH